MGGRHADIGKAPNVRVDHPGRLTRRRSHEDAIPRNGCGRTTPGRLGVTPFIAELVINHSKDVLEETYDLWDYFDEKRDALERLERYPQGVVIRIPKIVGRVGVGRRAPSA